MATTSNAGHPATVHPESPPGSAPTRDSVAPSKSRTFDTLEAIAEAVLTVDAQGTVDYMNPAAETLTGWRLREAAGKAAAIVAPILARGAEEAPKHPVEQCLESRESVSGDQRAFIRRRDGGEADIEYTCTPIINHSHSFAGGALTFRDVTEKRAAQIRLNWAASHDPLTGLINRPELENRLGKLLEHASATGHTHALCYIDLDHFKAINDGCGHAAGDEFLKALAAALRTRIRGADTLARLGGDEFAMLLYSCPVDKARSIAETVGAFIADFSLDWKGHKLRSTSSIGVVEVNRETADLTELLAAADTACYAAKNDGGNRVHASHVTDSMISDRLGEIHWLRCMQHAITHDRFLLYSQAIVPAVDDRLPHGYELLLRLQDDKGQIFSPSHFLPAALRYHVMPDIDRWMARKVLAATSRSSADLRGSDWVSINVSGQSISSEPFLNSLLDMLRVSALPPERLCLEIAEASVVENLHQTQHFATRLKDKGYRIAIDGCGAEVGSFNVLRRLPVDFVKISATLIHKLTANPIDREIVLSLNRIAQRLGIRTVAECVADVDTLLELREIGVDYVQGHVIAEPRPVELSAASTVVASNRAG
ncbi:MAG: EAL domain-containing protein [Chromatiales bacterium]